MFERSHGHMLQKESYQVFAVKRMSSLTQQKKRSIVYVAPTSLLIAFEINFQNRIILPGDKLTSSMMPQARSNTYVSTGATAAITAASASVLVFKERACKPCANSSDKVEYIIR